jgi:hypothetical protein
VSDGAGYAGRGWVSMANWIKLENGYYRDPKTRRLKRLIGDKAFWVPPRLWNHCLERRKDDISEYSAEDLKDVLEYDGDADELLKALKACGFVSQDGETVVGWDERYGKMLRFYHDRAVHASGARWPSSRGDETGGEKTRPEKTKKHAEASVKDASSLLQAAVDSVAIYEAYPRRQGKQDALKAICKALGISGVTPEELLAKTRAYAAATAQWFEADRQYIPHPATWFNRGSYDDDPATWIRNAASKPAQRIEQPPSIV